ncbi:MAG: class I SAM-dependent methyltransferase [Deltaproteobacteria bacterium]|nr:class I SAM-dependent methyltransferase [Deltaproteobacteria bacterium]
MGTPLDEARQAYDAWHGQHEVDEEADAPWHLLARAHLPDVAGLRVLEIGCGRGGFAAWLDGLPEHLRPAAILAADFSETAVEKGRAFAARRGLRRVTFQREDLMGLTLADGSLDAAFSFETLEHVPTPRRALAELHRVLRPGGLLCVTFPNYLGLQGLHRTWRELTGRPWTEGGQPINHPLTLPGVLAWIRLAGFAVEAVHGEGHYLPVPRRAPLRLRALDRAGPLKWLAAHPFVVARKRG